MILNAGVKILFRKDLKYPLFRCCSTQHSKTPPRVRFAPSPTGFLHLGGLRTALYNYLFAKANHGKFIVRIEDTDQTRIVANAQEQLFQSLEWAGIRPDESVLHGGDFGPYVQSQRLELYNQHLKALIENGQAYYCFCTERRLELLRRDAIRANEKPKYDNRCRHLHPDKVAEKLQRNDPKVVRFKFDKNDVTLNDLVCGEKHFNTQSDGDFVIMKSDGYPTYHLANVIDDHLMKITHVLRGVEWQISTPKHLAMYSAFNWEAPQYAHLPLILSPNGTKLSKRNDDASVEYYKKLGIFPQTLNNFITINGGGFNWDEASALNSHSMDDLIAAFDISKVNNYPSRLQPENLSECNRLEIQRQVNDPILLEQLLQQARNLIENSFVGRDDILDIEDTHIINVLKFSNPSLTNLQQLLEGDPLFLWILPKLKEDYVQPDWMDKLISELEHTEFTKPSLVKMLKDFAKNEGIKFIQVMKTLRMLLSSQKDGYQVAEMMEILGKKSTKRRLSRSYLPDRNSKVKNAN